MANLISHRIALEGGEELQRQLEALGAAGAVKFFNHLKGFGFISGDDGTEYFVHESGVALGPLSPGDPVEFSTGRNRRIGRVKAVAVSVIGE